MTPSHPSPEVPLPGSWRASSNSELPQGSGVHCLETEGTELAGERRLPSQAVQLTAWCQANSLGVEIWTRHFGPKEVLFKCVNVWMCCCNGTLPFSVLRSYPSDSQTDGWSHNVYSFHEGCSPKTPTSALKYCWRLCSGMYESSACSLQIRKPLSHGEILSWWKGKEWSKDAVC